MSFFERFSDTVFLKTDSEIEKEIMELKSIRDKVIDKEKNDLDIKKLELGVYGENQIEYELKSSDIGMYVLHDITLEYEDLTAQIDYILCTPSGMYIVECKNLIGDITVDERGEFVREYIIHGKKFKEAIYSPFRQAQRHIELIKKRWLSKTSKLEVLLREKCFDNWYKPLVVFANSKGILKVNKNCPKDIKNRIIRIDQLNDYLKREKEKLQWDELYSRSLMLSNAESWLSLNVVRKRDYSNKYIFISADNADVSNAINNVGVENNNKQLIEKALKEFRTKKSKEKNLPAYYIFNNDELAKLVEILPERVEVLNDLKILEPIKVKLHGLEIVDIIKKFKN